MARAVAVFAQPQPSRFNGVMWRFRLACILFALAAPGAAIGQDLSGPPRIVDGATLEVAGTRLRLAGINAPPLGQQCEVRGRAYDCGKVSWSALMDLTAGATVRCRLTGDAAPDGTRRARCSAGGYDLAEGMVYTGWALAAGGEGGRYRPVEAGAKAARRGLWQGRFTTPWNTVAC